MYSGNAARVFLSPFRKDDESIPEALPNDVCNAFSGLPPARQLLQTDGRENVTAVLVPSLLRDDAVVRTASASLAFDIAAVIQRCVRRVRR